MLSRNILTLYRGSLTFSRTSLPACSVEVVRHRGNSTKHWDPRWRKLRATKFVKIDLPDFDEIRRDRQMTPEEMRVKMKEKGLVPPRPWMERPILISSTGGIFEGYVPPEGDGKITPVSVAGAKQRLEWIQKKSKSMMALKKLRNYDEEFEIPDFATKAQEIYIDAHRALADKDKDKMHDLVTEHCFPEMMTNVRKKTIRWNFISSLEPPRVVHIRCTDVISKENVFAQITVRIHSKQTLAVYDRFGRLMYGSETTPKDVLEYVVYEKHLPNQYGLWRIHAKIIPDWMPAKEPPSRTFRKLEMQEPPPPVPATPAKVEETEEVEHQPQRPQLASA